MCPRSDSLCFEWIFISSNYIFSKALRRNTGCFLYLKLREFLTEDEEKKLLKHVPEIRKLFRNDLLQGKSALLEWSYAMSCNAQKEPVGKEYLVFYEARTI